MGGTLLQVDAMRRGAVDQIGATHEMGGMIGEYTGFSQALQEPYVIGPAYQLGQLMGVRQYKKLHQKFYVDDTTRILF